MFNDAPTILIVEDSADDEALTIRAISRTSLQLRIVVARDGVEALGVLGIDGGSRVGRGLVPDLILLDVRLPFLSGWEVLRSVRNCPDTRTVPVCIFSSSDHQADLEQARALGATAYLQKPVGFDDYISALVGMVNAQIRGLPAPPCPWIRRF